MPFALNDFSAGLSDGTRDLIVDYAQGMIGLNGSQLHESDSDNEVRVVDHSLARDVVVVDTTLCLHTIKSFCWNLEFTQKVGLYSVFLFFNHNTIILSVNIFISFSRCKSTAFFPHRLYKKRTIICKKQTIV